MSNLFTSTDPAFASTDTWLPAGNHIVDITKAQGGTSSGGHPQIELEFENANGFQKRNQVITEGSVGFAVALFESAGIPAPTDDDIEDGLRLKDSYLKQLVGKKTGIVVRDEPGFNDPTKTFATVKGFVHPSQVKEKDSDVTSQDDTNAFKSFGATGSGNSKDIPFHHDEFVTFEQTREHSSRW